VILIIDNYDSFTYNLYQLVRSIANANEPVEVIRNDALGVEALRALDPTHVVLSPGPGHPDDSRLSLQAAPALPETPVFGVCLGHQALAVAYGGRVGRAPAPTHGRAVAVHHDGTGLFAGMDRPLSAALYHSLAVTEDALPEVLRVTARTAAGDIMALSHVGRPHHGVQFHPESFLTRQGRRLLANFLEIR
jgi:anthranilate synthase/aminodeoxychorismate synthase-like glutamine amidotransferase